MDPQAWMSLEEVARYLRLPPAKVQSLLSGGELPGTFAHGGWRVQRAAADLWLRASQGAPPQAAPSKSASVPRAWQSGATKSPAPASAPPAGQSLRYQPGMVKRPAAPPRIVDEPIHTTPASLEMDLSLLEVIDFSEPSPDETPDEEA